MACMQWSNHMCNNFIGMPCNTVITNVPVLLVVRSSICQPIAVMLSKLSFDSDWSKHIFALSAPVCCKLRCF